LKKGEGRSPLEEQTRRGSRRPRRT
jgi:hypothetical protein